MGSRMEPQVVAEGRSSLKNGALGWNHGSRNVAFNRADGIIFKFHPQPLTGFQTKKKGVYRIVDTPESTHKIWFSWMPLDPIRWVAWLCIIFVWPDDLPDINQMVGQVGHITRCGMEFKLPAESWNWDQCWDDHRNRSVVSCLRRPSHCCTGSTSQQPPASTSRTSNNNNNNKWWWCLWILVDYGRTRGPRPLAWFEGWQPNSILYMCANI